MITVIVVAPTFADRARLAALLKPRPDFRVVAAAPGAPLAGQAEEVRADVVLCALDDQALRRALRDLSASGAPPPIVVLADDVRAFWTGEALRAGMRAVLARGAGGGEIVAAIDATVAGLLVLHPDGATAVLAGSSGHHGPAAEGTRAALTPREAEVLGMMAEGLPNKLIAARLGISSHTVKFHVAAIFAKLGAGSRTEAVTTGLRQGLIIV